ncbi:MAG TPA: alginate lyase family protein [Pyrinomonadaceae bacterium]|nr:alginate lyase family protein [Pyrinomonadaceae bacterium]
MTHEATTGATTRAAAAGRLTTSRVRIRPRPIFCVVADAYRDLAVAESVCAGRFTHAGLTLDLGVEPDWTTRALPPDAEWRIEWSKFYYGLDLAHAYRETGDERYPRAWERLVRSWIGQVPAAFDSSDVSARRVLNWIYAWDSFASAPRAARFSEGFEEKLLASLAEQVAHLRDHLTPERNHRTLELYALFVAALALPQLDPGGALLDFSTAQLHRNLLTDVRPDGVHREHSTHYHMLVLRSFLGARENARRFGLAFPDGFDAHLQRACDFAMHCHRPDGSIPALSDSDTASYLDLLALAAGLFDRPDYLYVATSGARGVPPEQSSASFPDGGYFIQRSSWQEGGESFRDARFLVFDAGALGDGGHGHYDLLNVEIAAGGRPLVVDPGRYTYSEHGENWRRWFKGTAAHNTVCVDGLDQTPYRRGKPKGETARARLLERFSAPGLDALRAVADSPAYEARHARRVFFVACEYWLIVDQLDGDRPHRYDLRFHLAPGAWRRTRTESNGTNRVVRAPGLALVFDAARTPQLEEGWVAPVYGVKHPAPVVSVVAEGEAESCFFTLVAPLGAGAPAPKLIVHRAEGELSLRARVSVVGVGSDGASTDLLTWGLAAQEFDLGALRGRAAAAWARTRAGGGLQSFAACDVRELSWATGEESGAFYSEARPQCWVAWGERRGLRHGAGEGEG